MMKCLILVACSIILMQNICTLVFYDALGFSVINTGLTAVYDDLQLIIHMHYICTNLSFNPNLPAMYE